MKVYSVEAARLRYSQTPFVHSIALGDLPAITPCDETVMQLLGQDMPQSCNVALSRNKTVGAFTFVLRVGGGELWDDALRAVDNANYWLDSSFGETVEILSGAAGTVSAAGGWMACGGACC